MHRYLLICIYFCLFISCYKPPYPDCPITTRSGYDKRLHLVNNSTDSIALGFQFGYPDTTLYHIMGPPYFGLPDFIILPGEDKVWKHSGCWEGVFMNNEAGVIQIFLFDIQMLRFTEWGTVQAEKKYLKRYQFTLEEIKALNWQIVYDP